MDSQSIPSSLCSWAVQNLEFEDAFAEVYPKLSDGPSLLILDQQVWMKGRKVFKRILKPSQDRFPATFGCVLIHPQIAKATPTFRHLKIPEGRHHERYVQIRTGP